MSKNTLQIKIPDLLAVEALARVLACCLKAGDAVGLNGTLGAGKTTLVQVLAKALNITEPVTSPTFVLIHQYPSTQFTLIHADLYRLGTENASRIAQELTEPLDDGTAVACVEWAEYGDYLQDYLNWHIDIALQSNEQRLISITLTDSGRFQQLKTLLSQSALVLVGTEPTE